MRTGVLGVVLAGGESRRLGRDKALVEASGTSLLERAVAVLRSTFGDVVVAAPADRGYLTRGAPLIGDDPRGEGPLAGLVAALERAAGRAVFALAVDLPLASAELLDYVAGEAPKRLSGPLARVPVFDGRPQPLCALYAPGARALAAEQLAAGRPALRDLLARLDPVLLPITSDLPFFDPRLGLNVNHPADLSRLSGPVSREQIAAERS